MVSGIVDAETGGEVRHLIAKRLKDLTPSVAWRRAAASFIDGACNATSQWRDRIWAIQRSRQF